MLDNQKFIEDEDEEENPNEIWETVNGVTFYKEDKDNKIWWVESENEIGTWAFSFDKKKIFYMFQDYPYKLSPEQKEIFDRENPYWADFFKDRKYN